MPEHTGLKFTLPAMRILENEHRYLSFLMGEWHNIVLWFEQEQILLEEARTQLQKLRTAVVEFSVPLKNHTGKEEAHFFPLLGRYIGFEQGPLVGIQEEHREIDGYIGHFLHHTEGGAEQMGLEDIRAAVRDAGEAFEVLTVHFVKEETVIFPMAETQLSPKDKERLSRELNTLIT
ncbi:hemerythrin domain-containing protein [Paenibacillus sp. MMS20-IR301]|uniref:hemerythrin domain-containing protein n=1 Tax=Paenibacillus sp. MMS20-IR301 TaxID=2895946 RepID=UPI0028EFB10A|nr:hemerythrin domain-containing protein [Paenibacillus sp. MMS20-IR301]WNS40697.1 hemerythrin domain-containing protein [Paenibacillus sp. MMS20-IR301]